MILKFDNGNFVSVSEDVQKIGAMKVAISAGQIPTTANVIPAKTESFFLKMVSERVASTIKGIAIVSVFFKSEININATKVLIDEIMEMVKNV